MISPLHFIFFLLYSACCFFAYGGWIVQKLQWSHHRHTSHVDTFIDFCCFEFLITTLYVRVYRSISVSVSFVMFLSCFVFGALGELQTLNFAITSSNPYREWSASAAIFMICMLILFSFVAAYHVYLLFCRHHDCSFICFYLLALSIWLAFIVVSFFLVTRWDPDSGYVFHAHHWLLAYGFSFFACFPRSNVSRLSLGIGLGIFLHGFSSYGRTPLLFSSSFYPSTIYEANM